MTTVGANSRFHWPEYLMEGLGLGLFMVSACALGVLLGHPASPVVHALPSPFGRRAMMGLAMGVTAVALIHSPWGRRSGAHLNPAVSLTFWSLGRAPGRDVAGYALGQFAGAAAGTMLSSALLGRALADPAVRYVVTVPGPGGPALAFAAEAVISLGLMLTVLATSHTPRLERHTPLFAGGLIALWILLESPLSGTSMNPARTTGSAIVAHDASALWVYFLAPPLGMLAAAEIYLRWRGAARVFCAKLLHPASARCIFCEAREARAARHEPSPSPYPIREPSARPGHSMPA